MTIKCFLYLEKGLLSNHCFCLRIRTLIEAKELSGRKVQFCKWLEVLEGPCPLLLSSAAVPGYFYYLPPGLRLLESLVPNHRFLAYRCTGSQASRWAQLTILYCLVWKGRNHSLSFHLGQNRDVIVRQSKSCEFYLALLEAQNLC